MHPLLRKSNSIIPHQQLDQCLPWIGHLCSFRGCILGIVALSLPISAFQLNTFLSPMHFMTVVPHTLKWCFADFPGWTENGFAPLSAISINESVAVHNNLLGVAELCCLKATRWAWLPFIYSAAGTASLCVFLIFSPCNLEALHLGFSDATPTLCLAQGSHAS